MCFVFFFLSSAEAFEIKGLQPLSPYGVFSTFSAESLKQNEMGLGLTIEKSSGPDFHRSVFHFAYGLHDKLEFNITLPYITEWLGKIDGFEDLNLGIKHRIMDETKHSPAIAYMITASAPSGRDEFTTDGSVGGGLLLTKKVGPFKGHLNVLYFNPEESGLKEDYSLNLGTELAVTHKSKVLVEVIGRKEYFRSRINLVEWRFGYRIATTDYIYTTFGAGFDIKDRNPDYRLMFSVNVVLPVEKKEIQRIYYEK